MKKVWINKAKSFREADNFDVKYYMKMSSSERVDTMQTLREIYLKFKAHKNENGKRLRRVIKIIQ